MKIFIGEEKGERDVRGRMMKSLPETKQLVANQLLEDRHLDLLLRAYSRCSLFLCHSNSRTS